MKVFDLYAERYDLWYDMPFGSSVFPLEVECLKRCGLVEEPSLEVGVGSGRFAKALGINVGVDTSFELLKKAKGRGLKVLMARAEELPFKDGAFKSVFMIVSLCFFEDPLRALRSARRVISEDGKLFLGLVLSESPWAKFYMEKAKGGHPIYSHARFYSFSEIKDMLREGGFELKKVFTTLFEEPQDQKPIKNREIREGFHPEGGFFCIAAKPS
ncbi:MAG: class I SAM-dependent methyltransferase [Aquificaceae bacterium]